MRLSALGYKLGKLSCGSVYMQEIWGENVGFWDVNVSIAKTKDASIMILVIRLTFTRFFAVPSPGCLERNDTDRETKRRLKKTAESPARTVWSETRQTTKPNIISRRPRE